MAPLPAAALEAEYAHCQRQLEIAHADHDKALQELAVLKGQICMERFATADLRKEVDCLRVATKIAVRDVRAANAEVRRAGYMSLLYLSTAVAACTYIALQAMAGSHAHASSKPSR